MGSFPAFALAAVFLLAWRTNSVLAGTYAVPPSKSHVANSRLFRSRSVVNQSRSDK
jgi:hypothetical protein